MTGAPERSPKVVLEKPGIKPATPGLQGIPVIHYTTAASMLYNCDPLNQKCKKQKIPDTAGLLYIQACNKLITHIDSRKIYDRISDFTTLESFKTRNIFRLIMWKIKTHLQYTCNMYKLHRIYGSQLIDCPCLRKTPVKPR